MSSCVRHVDSFTTREEGLPETTKAVEGHEEVAWRRYLTYTYIFELIVDVEREG